MGKIKRNADKAKEWSKDASIAKFELYNLDKDYQVGDTLHSLQVGEVTNRKDPTKTVKGLIFIKDGEKKILPLSTFTFARPLFKKKLLSNGDGTAVETSEFTGKRILPGELGELAAKFAVTAKTAYDLCCDIVDYMEENGLDIVVSLYDYEPDTYFKTKKGELSNGIEFPQFNFVKRETK